MLLKQHLRHGSGWVDSATKDVPRGLLLSLGRVAEPLFAMDLNK